MSDEAHVGMTSMFSTEICLQFSTVLRVFELRHSLSRRRNNRAWRGKYFARCTMRYLLLSFLLFLCVVASAAAQPRSVADLANYRGGDREEILKAGPKKEGKLVWYTSLTA